MSAPIERKVVSLVRVSTDKQKKDADVDYQRNQIMMTARHFNLTVVKEFSLEGIGGLNVHKTEEFHELKRMVGRKEIHGLVIPNIDRLARTTEFQAVADLTAPFLELMGEQNTKRLWFRNVELDITNKDDRNKIWEALQGAENERLMLKWRTSSQKDAMRWDPSTKIDKLPAGIIAIPIPGKKKRYTFQYDPDIRAKIVEACNRVLAGDVLTDIALDLGYRSSNGLKETLRSEWWIGNKTRLKTTNERKWNEDKQKYFVGGRKDHDNPIRVETNLADDPAISKEVFDAVQVKLNESSNSWTQKRSLNKQFIGTGILHCGVCGEKLYHKNQDGRKHLGYFWCASKAKTYRLSSIKKSVDCGFGMVRADSLEDEINLQITLYLTDPALVEANLEEALNTESREEKKRSLVRVEHGIAELEDERRRMLNAIRKGIAKDEDFAADMKDCDFKIGQQKSKAAFLQSEINTSISSATVTKMATRIAAEFASFGSMPFEKKLALTKKYFTKIVVEKDEVRDALTLHFTLKPGNPAMYQPTDPPPPKPTTPSKPPKSPKPPRNKGIRVTYGGTINNVPPVPRCSKSKGGPTFTFHFGTW